MPTESPEYDSCQIIVPAADEETIQKVEAAGFFRLPQSNADDTVTLIASPGDEDIDGQEKFAIMTELQKLARQKRITLLAV